MSKHKDSIRLYYTLTHLQDERKDTVNRILAFAKRNDIEMVSIFMSILYSIDVLIAYTNLSMRLIGV